MRRSLTAAALALAGTVAPLGGQTIDFTDQIDQLHSAVLALAASSTAFQNDLGDAVRLHARVIDLRGADDPARVACLIDQASLLMGTGDLEGARVFVARAVAQAMRTGDAMAAADASAIAALLAQEDGDVRAARIYRKNARSLALSSELTTEESNAIASRLYGASWKASANNPAVVVVE
jgi:ATP/maltotriose-dependent transcriptional regulator MalT